MFTEVCVSIPSESLAVSTTSNQVSSWKLWPVVGIVKVPPDPVTESMNGWMCPRWWNTTFQVSPLAGMDTSSASLAWPENVIVSPARNFKPLIGLVMIGCGGLPTVIVTTSEGVVLFPSEVVSLAV